MPVAVSVTVTSRAEITLRVAVTVDTPVASAIFIGFTERVTEGISSSSVMVIISCCVPFSVALVTPVISKITVSFTSTNIS